MIQDRPAGISQNTRLLIVDDDQRANEALSQYLTLKGYEVRAVQRGDEALVLAGVFHPEVVLLDLLLPGMTGVDTLKGLKQLVPQPKVLIVSGADHEDVIRGVLQLGADFYLCKPLNLTELEHVIRGCCPSLRAHE